MSQYDMEIIYIWGKDNSIADVLSQLPPGAFPGKADDNKVHTPHKIWLMTMVATMLRITTDTASGKLEIS